MLSIDPKNIFSLLNFRALIQDGGKIQNGTQKRKNLIFAAKWPKITNFINLKSFLFVLLVSIRNRRV
jgi:hypothetical protein